MNESDSLKSKRMILNRLKDKVQNKFNVSVAEVGGQDLWQRAVIGIATVSNSISHAESILDNVIKFIEHDGCYEVTNISKDYV